MVAGRQNQKIKGGYVKFINARNSSLEVLVHGTPEARQEKRKVSVQFINARNKSVSALVHAGTPEETAAAAAENIILRRVAEA